MNLAVNKKAIVDGLWKGQGSADTPYSYWYYPLNKGHDPNWKVPAYNPERAKQLLAEAGFAGGFEMRVNPMLMVWVLDGIDVMEAVALDWEKTGVSQWVYAGPPFDEPVLGWQRTVWSKAAFYMLAEGPYDAPIEAILRESDPEKRGTMQRALAQQFEDNFLGVKLGTRNWTWALSKKVGEWPTLQVPLESNYEYITYSGQQ